jgi:hypothetical protein
MVPSGQNRHKLVEVQLHESTGRDRPRHLPGPAILPVDSRAGNLGTTMSRDIMDLMDNLNHERESSSSR